MMKAQQLKEIDLDYRCHLVAYLSKVAGAEKSSGTKGKTRPVYSTFQKFYDYEKELEKAKHPEEVNSMFERFKQYHREEK